MFNLKKLVLDLLFPIECLGCGQPKIWLCEFCRQQIKINFLSRAHLSSRSLSGIFVAADYHQPTLLKAIHPFKYNFIADLGVILAGILIEFLKNQIEKSDFFNFDLIAAVPLTKKRKLWRGFNQSEILAKTVAINFNWTYSSGLLIKKYQTKPQVGLSAQQRLMNITGAFKLDNQAKVKGKKILLIDDVMTTGATLSECAKVLRQAGAKEVWGLVIASDQDS